MANRPGFIEIPPPKSAYGQHRAMLSPRFFASPRIGHVDGEVPPELSPLDALAAQGRLLAKQLDQTVQDGKRISRLPPFMIANTLAQARPGFPPRSISADPQQSTPTHEPKHTPTPTPSNPNNPDMPRPRRQLDINDPRPVSHYPRLSAVSDNSHDYAESPVLPPSEFHTSYIPYSPVARDSKPFVHPVVLTPRTTQSPELKPAIPEALQVGDRSMLTPLRTQSPETMPSGLGIAGAMDMGVSQQGRGHGVDSVHDQSPVQFSPSRQGPVYRGLIAPSQNYSRSSNGSFAPSIRSVPPESPEEEQVTLLEPAIPLLHRKLSSSSAMSATTPPRSPLYPPPPRSPSGGSDRSLAANMHPRTRLNFSRPLSRASRPSLDIPSRQNSSDSQPGVFTDDNIGTPVSMTSEEYFDASDRSSGPAPTYVYSTFNLPRGRPVPRTSLVTQDDSREPRSSTRDQRSTPRPIVKSASQDDHDIRIPLPTPIASLQDDSSRRYREASPNKTTERARSRSVGAKASASLRVEALRRPADVPMPLPLPNHLRVRPGLTTTASNDAIDARKSTKIPSREFTAEDHLNKGIECHEQGSLKESTYHLRIAAKANHPTAMLLYALACRHGWGMRPNQPEGVEWLKKAAEMVGSEVAHCKSVGEEGSPAEVAERKTRRAQLALGIYELGVSYMNGWGIEQDKVLALRCFEIAAVWGDCDALSEAGYCYAQGIGCKKDMKKSAKYYRMAESKGMSMVGNSWIYKSKYRDDEDDDRQGRATKKAGSSSDKDKDKDKKPRDKSRTRTMFTRKKSFAATPV